MSANKITTTIRLDENDYKTLQTIAAEDVRSVNNLMEFILKKYIQEAQAKQ